MIRESGIYNHSQEQIISSVPYEKDDLYDSCNISLSNISGLIYLFIIVNTFSILIIIVEFICIKRNNNSQIINQKILTRRNAIAGELVHEHLSEWHNVASIFN